MDFPCDMLANMGKDQGFDPNIKIEQCKIWANEETASTVATMTTLGIL
jgi:hypothetical protein